MKFTWYGKENAIIESMTPSIGALRPDKESSKNWDNTENLYIEGDNLEVLKLLQKSYFGKVKMIYIDPPYNTGKDFVYKDNFKDNIANYKEITNQSTKANPETNGRYHTDWLNMMYPRLKLARNLLTEDGSILVSIDYNELANMKKIMDEVFGEENFQREITWRMGWISGYKTAAPNFIRNHDTILFYSKDCTKHSFEKKYIWNKDFKPLIKKEPSISSKMDSLGLDRKQQDELFEFINHENRPEKYPIEDTWNCNEYDDLNSIAIVSFSGEKISKILDINQDFKGQKSIKMLQRLIISLTKDNDTILDFFSGTSSTAHAVIQQNVEDLGERNFIMVQLPEITDQDSEAYNKGYKNICEIGKERIRRSGDKIVSENKNKEGIENLDIGFKVFKLEYNCGGENYSMMEEGIKVDIIKRPKDKPICKFKIYGELYYLVKTNEDIIVFSYKSSIKGKVIASIFNIKLCKNKDYMQLEYLYNMKLNEFNGEDFIHSQYVTSVILDNVYKNLNE